MKPLPFDESLLTAYLDDELTKDERDLVEEQLNTNEHWKQLLVELQTIQGLVRELPTPSMTTSLAVGPWTQHARPTFNAATQATESIAKKSGASPKSAFALAAGLILCALGSFAWLRFGPIQNQVAHLERMANLNDSPPNATTAPSADVATVNNQSIEASTSIASTEMELAKPELQLQSPSPQLSAKTEASGALGGALNLAKEPLAAMQATKTIATQEPFATMYAVRIKSVDNDVVDGLFRKEIASPKEEATDKSRTYVAPSSNDYFFQSTSSKPDQIVSLLMGATSSRHELRVSSSDLPLIIQRLRELGWEVQGLGSVVVNESPDSGSVRGLVELRSETENTDSNLPPMLTGAILESTDWIRIVFDEM